MEIADGTTAYLKLATPEEIAALPVVTSISVEPLSIGTTSRVFT